MWPPRLFRQVFGGLNCEVLTMTQNERILRHLQDGGTLTQAEAFLEYGVGRLSSRICELRRAGYPIRREFVTRKNRYGEHTSFCKYWLENSAQSGADMAGHVGIQRPD